MQNLVLKKAIYLSLSGAALMFVPALNAQASTTMYNLYGSATTPVAADIWADGWVWGDNIDSPGNSSAATPGWMGTSCSTCTPFGFVGGMAINWAAQLTGAGALTVSQQDSFNRYGVYADIDTSAGSWRSNSAPNGSGNRHSIDIGLFKSDVTQTVRLDISGITNSNGNYGMTIYKGMAQNAFYNHYGYPIYNSSSNYLDKQTVTTTTTTIGNTTSTTTTTTNYYLDYVARTLIDPTSHLTSNTLSFVAEAGQIYTIVLGGNNGGFYSDYDNYQLNIASVPLPSAVWLFGSAVLGLALSKKRT